MNLEGIKGIGPKTLEYLKQENILTIKDLVTTYPKSYTVYEVNVGDLFSCEPVCVSAVVVSKPIFLKYRRNINTIIFYANIQSYKIKCVSFSLGYLRYKLFTNTPVILYGRYKKENKEFIVHNAFFEPFSIKIETDYHLKQIKNDLMRKAVKSAFQVGINLEDNLPKELIEQYKLYPFVRFLTACHFPQTKMDYIQVQRRRKYEEFFWYSVSLELLKVTRKKVKKPERVIDKEQISRVLFGLGFELTPDQKEVMKDIYRDISADYSMNRLIQGDVGCGKSILAYLSAVLEVSAGYQAVIMVPTELLAIQQYQNITKLLEGMHISVELLTSGIKKKDKEDILYRLMNHRVQIIVGTHALIEEKVIFHKLGIVIIDEQHRFGVQQRSRLISKFPKVDCLYLTATPIPRTLGLTAFGDLDISSVHSMPKNRKPIITKVYPESKLDYICEFIKKKVAEKEQVYIVSALVEENTELDAIDIRQAYAYFEEKLPNIRIGMVHGKLASSVKNKIMEEFKNGIYDVLLATTVIEVGVDIKNATAMVILDANRYGLAQIHQLRGRVGRSDKQGYCFLVSKVENERLNILSRTTDGFEIASEDFKLRGPGNYFGDEQSGFVGLNYADFEADFKIWSYAKQDGERYCHTFLETDSKNPKFLELLTMNKMQKGKIN